MSEKTKPCGVLFDLDGVLLDSEGQYTIFWAAIDKEYPTGIPNFAAYIKGFHLTRILNYFTDDEVKQLIIDKLQDFEQNMHFEFFPGAMSFIEQLREAGIPIAIVTSSDSKKMQGLYCQHPDFPKLFDKIITGDMVRNAKPDPECFQTAARAIGVDISDCIVVEDSRNGLLAGRASGARVIGIATTLPIDQLQPLCDVAVDSISQLTLSMLAD